MKPFALALLFAGLGNAQTSGLTTGEVTYTVPLTNPSSAVTRIDDGSGILANAIICGGDYPGGPNYPACPQIVAGIHGASIHHLSASDGTGSCYLLYYTEALYLGQPGDICQTSFGGCGAGEPAAVYSNGGSGWTTAPAHGVTLDQIDYPFSSFGGTAVAVIGGVCTPIPNTFDMLIQIYHHTVQVWAPPTRYRGWHLVPMQQIDAGSQVVVTPSGD